VFINNMLRLDKIGKGPIEKVNDKQGRPDKIGACAKLQNEVCWLSKIE
jgi:hypothetical protein